jgi:CRISPR-associated endonuclease/helicase Cas3
MPEGPVLVILEDLTGAGKTEAAHLLVHRLLTARRASGAYWAMPTQATANAMYARQADLLDRLFDDPEQRPSLVLAHGQRQLHERFRASVLDGASEEDRPPDSEMDLDEDVPSTATCAAWLADDRRASMLADVGAGTIDQALLAVLSTKFNTIRLFGLSDKVLVVDEAHAYDHYMGVELEELLRFHAALGGHAIVLSATLPRARREQLVGAWKDGVRGGQRRLGDSAFVGAAAYPLATVVAAEGVQEVALKPAPWSRRRVPLRLVHDLDAAVSHVVTAARSGACVAWVRNTVDDCLAAATRLRGQGLDPMVFHARFAQADRQRREEDVVHDFGPAAPDELRRGRVLIATQVIEQSLDLDFDAMVSDLAPVDLLVQRAGRLQRHPARDFSRPAGIARELVILSPQPKDSPEPGWLGGIFAATAHVYKDPGILWRTVQTLHRAQCITMPENLRDLIENVYGSTEVPDSLLPGANQAVGEASAQAATATFATLKVGDGYDANAQAWVNDLQVRTRVGERQTTVRLARACGDGSLAAWSGHRPEWKAWALSEVRLSARRVPAGVEVEPRFAPQVAATRRTWGRFEQDIPVLPLESIGGETYRGVLLPLDGRAPIHVRYTAGEGLTYEARD